MSLESAKQHLREWNRDQDVFLFDQPGDTVEMAATALGVSPDEIAKCMCFYDKDDGVIIIVTAGTGRIENRKFKDEFVYKAKMVSYDELETLVGHPVGGVGPFGVNSGVKIYLDISLKEFEFIYPACGSNNSTIKLSIPELELYTKYERWIDVTKDKVFY